MVSRIVRFSSHSSLARTISGVRDSCGGYGASVVAPIAREIPVKYFHKSAAYTQ